MTWKRIVWLLLLAPFQGWGFFSLYFGAGSPALCLSLAILYTAGHFYIVWKAPIRWIFLVSAAWFAVLPLGAFLLARPSMDRNWQADVARLPYAEVSNDVVTVRHVRYCDYQSETNFIVRYEDRTYDLRQLTSIDVIFSDWGLGRVVHTMLSFGFGSNDYLCLSMEARKEQGESYSAVRGFFRQYELIAILADERDVVRLRTHYRQGETVYLYRLRVESAQQARREFLMFLHAVNWLHEHPAWYNALTANCMTSLFKISQRCARQKRSMWNPAVILNGTMPEWMYHGGAIDTTQPFEELKKNSAINERAREADRAGDFSARIRAGLPGMDWRLADTPSPSER